MIFRRAVVAGTLALLIAAAAAAAAATAGADQAYTVDGSDVFRVGNNDALSRTLYHGMQQLSIARKGNATTYVARVEYDKNGEAGKLHQRGSFTTTVLASGEQSDGPAHDPDYLTVLNQPFSVQLDAPTMRDLGHLRRPVPFDFPSPMTGATLHGTLRRLPDALVGGTRAMGVAFGANGPLHGALPDRPEMELAGTITMQGTAYYAYGTALLLALDATLAIDGNLDATATRSPVSIVYTRSIRHATGQQAASIRPLPHRT